MVKAGSVPLLLSGEETITGGCRRNFAGARQFVVKLASPAFRPHWDCDGAEPIVRKVLQSAADNNGADMMGVDYERPS